jgi:hypothetical protein
MIHDGGDHRSPLPDTSTAAAVSHTGGRRFSSHANPLPIILPGRSLVKLRYPTGIF